MSRHVLPCLHPLFTQYTCQKRDITQARKLKGISHHGHSNPPRLTTADVCFILEAPVPPAPVASSNPPSPLGPAWHSHVKALCQLKVWKQSTSGSSKRWRNSLICELISELHTSLNADTPDLAILPFVQRHANGSFEVFLDLRPSGVLSCKILMIWDAGVRHVSEKNMHVVYIKAPYIFHECCELCAGVVTAQISVAGIPLPHIENIWFELISADCKFLDAVALD